MSIEKFTRLLLVAEAYALVGRDVVVANLGAQVADMNIESARANNHARTPHGIENLLTGEDSTLGKQESQYLELLDCKAHLLATIGNEGVLLLVQA